MAQDFPNSEFRIPNSSERQLAVIVLTWDGKADTLACLASLGAAGHPRPDEAVVVVDNGSKDGTLEAVAERFPWAQRIQNGQNLGFAGGNNVGLRWALEHGCRYAMLLNNDTEVPAGCLETLLSRLDADGTLGAVQPLLVLHGERDRIDSSGVELFSLPGARDRQIGRPVEEAPKATEPVFGVCAAAAVYRCEALEKAGLLDEDLFVLLEDVDLCFRIRLAGYGMALVPEARVYHKRGISSQGALSGEKKFVLHRNIRALALRYWPQRYLLQYAPFLAKGWAWGALYAARTGRWAQWSDLMRRARAQRRDFKKNPAWHQIQKQWMRPLGWAHYPRKLRERLGGPPAIPQ